MEKLLKCIRDGNGDKFVIPTENINLETEMGWEEGKQGRRKLICLFPY